MKETIVITISIDLDLKVETDAIFKDLGISTDQAITMFLKQVQLDKVIPFEQKLRPNPKPRIAGLNQGQSYMSSDFDEPLDGLFD